MKLSLTDFTAAVPDGLPDLLDFGHFMILPYFIDYIFFTKVEKIDSSKISFFLEKQKGRKVTLVTSDVLERSDTKFSNCW